MLSDWWKMKASLPPLKLTKNINLDLFAAGKNKEAVGNAKATTPRKGKSAKARMLRERTDLPLTERHVSMSNALARGAQVLSLSQKRILALAMAKTDSLPVRDLQEATHAEAGWRVRLLATEYAETYDVDPTTAYEQLQETSRSLLKALWRIPTEGRRGTNILEGQWLSLAEYSRGEGRVDITFHHKIAPHLLALRREFTTYKLKQAAALRSIYSWRLFECLQSWRKKGSWHVSIEDFQAAMNAPASCTKDFKDLRKRVIEPAVSELIAKEQMAIEWEPERSGRRVVGLTFKFGPHPQNN